MLGRHLGRDHGDGLLGVGRGELGSLLLVHPTVVGIDLDHRFEDREEPAAARVHSVVSTPTATVWRSSGGICSR